VTAQLQLINVIIIKRTSTADGNPFTPPINATPKIDTNLQKQTEVKLRTSTAHHDPFKEPINVTHKSTQPPIYLTSKSSKKGNLKGRKSLTTTNRPLTPSQAIGPTSGTYVKSRQDAITFLSQAENRKSLPLSRTRQQKYRIL